MTPLVLLPGMMCDQRLFRPQIEALSATTILHLPPLSGDDSIKAMAGRVLTHAPPRFALAGLSMGGIVAMEVIRQAPDRVARIALLDTNPLAESDRVKAGREPQIARVMAGRLREVMREEMKPNYLAAGPRQADILDLCMTMAENLGPQVFIDQSRALQTRRDQQDTLRRIAVPALVLCGEEDRLCPVKRHELMHDLIPGSRLEVIPGAGHIATLEQPVATNAALLSWLKT